MTTATHTELQQIAEQAAAYIARLNDECDTFQIDGETLSAVIAYEAETDEYRGDYWTDLPQVEKLASDLLSYVMEG